MANGSFDGAVEWKKLPLLAAALPAILITSNALHSRGTLNGPPLDQTSFLLHIVDLNLAIELNPHSASAYSNRGTAHMREGAKTRRKGGLERERSAPIG